MIILNKHVYMFMLLYRPLSGYIALLGNSPHVLSVNSIRIMQSRASVVVAVDCCI